MAGLNKIEGYLMDLGVSYEEPEPGTYLIDDAGKGLIKIFATWVDPIVIVRAKVMDVPGKNREAFFAELLKLNYEGLLHGAYALDGAEVVLMDSLEYADMSKSEFEASIDAIGFALSEHYPILSRFKGA